MTYIIESLILSILPLQSLSNSSETDSIFFLNIFTWHHQNAKFAVKWCEINVINCYTSIYFLDTILKLYAACVCKLISNKTFQWAPEKIEHRGTIERLCQGKTCCFYSKKFIEKSASDLSSVHSHWQFKWDGLARFCTTIATDLHTKNRQKDYLILR